jgi:hypothetical protein
VWVSRPTAPALHYTEKLSTERTAMTYTFFYLPTPRAVKVREDQIDSPDKLRAFISILEFLNENHPDAMLINIRDSRGRFLLKNSG